MSVSAVSAATSSSQITNPYVQIRQDFQNIGKALQSGNISDAQQAFAKLQQDNPTIAQSQGKQTTNQTSDAFQTLSSSLQSGDLSGAQQAFSQLQQGMKGAGKGHGHHHHRQSSGTAQGTNQAGQVPQKTYNSQGSIQELTAIASTGSETSPATVTAVDILS